jgi:hypothetical protein
MINSRNKSGYLLIEAVSIAEYDNAFYCVAPNFNFIDYTNLTL